MNKLQACFLFILIAGLSTMASAEQGKPESAVVDVQNSFEFGTTYGEFRVMYPGVSEPEDSDVCQEAKIKLFKDGDCKPFLEYKVPGDRKADSGVFYFADKKATAGKYQAQVCLGDQCSAKFRSFTSIPKLKNRKQITCKRYKEEAGAIKTVGTFHLEVIPVTTMATMEVVEETPDSAYKKADLEGFVKSNPGYGKGYLVAAPMYDMTHYKQMFDTATKDASGKSKEFTSEYCTRKYILTANTHLVDPQTKEVKYRFKTTLNPAQDIIDEYILKGNSSVPVIQAYKADIKPGNYIVWMAFCTSYKDTIESTVCSEAYEQQLRIYAPLSKKMALIGHGGDAIEDSVKIQCYDSAMQSWDSTCLPELHATRQHLGVGQIGTKLYFVGGSADYEAVTIKGEEGEDDYEDELFAFTSNSTYILDLETRVWSQGPDMIVKRGSHGTAVLNGCIYVVGGLDTDTLAASVTGEKFNTTTGKWSSIASMSTARKTFSLVPVGDKLYAIGGQNEDPLADYNPPINVVECYDPIEDSWSTILSGTNMTARKQPAVAVLNDKIYVAGGIDNNVRLKTLEMYDPQTKEWKQLKDMNNPRAFATMVAYNKKLYIFGGYNLKTSEVYHPMSDSWFPLPAELKEPIFGAASLVIEANF